MRKFAPLALLALAALTAGALAQGHKGSHSPGAQANPLAGRSAPADQEGGPFAIGIYGAFQRMVETLDFTSKVRLGTTKDLGATEAVGAVAGLRGEITTIDGKLLVSYGKPCPTCTDPRQEEATLLVTARVSRWHEPVALPADLTGAALDDFITDRARAAGLDLTRPFPIRLKGTLTGVTMHVLTAANPHFKGSASGAGAAHGSHKGSAGGSGHGVGPGMAEQEVITAERLEGEVVGFFAPPAAQGIITHPGEPFHYHWVDVVRTRTAHLDAFGMAKGSELLLPRP